MQAVSRSSESSGCNQLIKPTVSLFPISTLGQLMQSKQKKGGAQMQK